MADTIKIGTLDISAFKVGSSDPKIYLGDTLLYPQTPPFEGKWLATFSDGSTSSAECDSTSAITQNEVTTSCTNLIIGQCVTTIGVLAFYDCRSLTSVTISNSVTNIEDRGFYSCYSLASVNIPDSVTSIGQNAFRNNWNMTACTIGSGVTSIGGSAFESCNLVNVVINGQPTMQDAAFYGNTNLTSVTMKSSVPPTIGDYMFMYWFNNENTILPNMTIYVPSESVEAYKTAPNWSTYADKIQAIPNS